MQTRLGIESPTCCPRFGFFHLRTLALSATYSYFLLFLFLFYFNKRIINFRKELRLQYSYVLKCKAEYGNWRDFFMIK